MQAKARQKNGQRFSEVGHKFLIEDGGEKWKGGGSKGRFYITAYCPLIAHQQKSPTPYIDVGLLV